MGATGRVLTFNFSGGSSAVVQVAQGVDSRSARCDDESRFAKSTYHAHHVASIRPNSGVWQTIQGKNRRSRSPPHVRGEKRLNKNTLKLIESFGAMVNMFTARPARRFCGTTLSPDSNSVCAGAYLSRKPTSATFSVVLICLAAD